MKTLHKKIAVFPGTFDPFTIGHMSLVNRGLTMLDEIVVAVGINEANTLPLRKESICSKICSGTILEYKYYHMIA